MKKEAVSGDLINYSFPNKGKFRPLFGRNKIEVDLNTETYEWSCDYLGKKINGKVSETTMADLINMGCLPEFDDPKFNDALKVFILRAIEQSNSICKETLDWDDDQE